MRIPLLLVLAAVIVVMVAGCGGAARNRPGDPNSTVPENYMIALRDAIATRNTDSITQQISQNYVQDCNNRANLVNAILATLGSGGDIDFTIHTITDKSVDEIQGNAEFDGGFTLTVTEGSDVRTLTRSGRMFLKGELARWVLYGNQECTP